MSVASSEEFRKSGAEPRTKSEVECLILTFGFSGKSFSDFESLEDALKCKVLNVVKSWEGGNLNN